MTDTRTTQSGVESHETPEPTTLVELEARLRSLDNERESTEEALARATTVAAVRALHERLADIRAETTILQRRRGSVREAEVARDIEREAARVVAENAAEAIFVAGPLAEMVTAFEGAWATFDAARDAAIAAGAPVILARPSANPLAEGRAWNRIVASLDEAHSAVVGFWGPMLAAAVEAVGEGSTSTEAEASTGRRQWGRK